MFFTDGGPPKFIACTSVGPSRFSCRVADGCTDGGRESGIQSVPGGGVLVSKDVEGQRYAITANTDGTLTGNVFFSATGAATFIFCQPAEGGAYSCSLADSCTQMPCTGQYTPLGTTHAAGELLLGAGRVSRLRGRGRDHPPQESSVPDPEMMAESSRQVSTTILPQQHDHQDQAERSAERGRRGGERGGGRRGAGVGPRRSRLLPGERLPGARSL